MYFEELMGLSREMQRPRQALGEQALMLRRELQVGFAECYFFRFLFVLLVTFIFLLYFLLPFWLDFVLRFSFRVLLSLLASGEELAGRCLEMERQLHASREHAQLWKGEL